MLIMSRKGDLWVSAEVYLEVVQKIGLFELS